ncbi:MAG: MMPL family transporter [Rhodomicrobium sp.]|nr:MMPL family transporter [Rhodomicrobium sp.]
MGAARDRCLEAGSRHRRRDLRPRARRSSGRGPGGQTESRAPRRFDAGRRCRAEQCLQRAADFDALRRPQSVQGDIGGRSGAAAAALRPLANLRHQRARVEVPLSAIATVETVAAPLEVNHQGQFPSLTVSFNLKEGVTLDEGLSRVLETIERLHLPDTIRVQPAGDALSQQQQGWQQPLLILAALVTVYIVLGILYESLVHPLTILSTLPSAGFGALLTLHAANLEFSLIALIGIILLIGIVKKNGILLVDFALEAERKLGLSSEEAIRRACHDRFRPILMTTLAAMFGALPLILAEGPGSELRIPLGLTIIGGLAVSQLLTVYTTPVIYLFLDKLRRSERDKEKCMRFSARHPALND